jgi:hypothetical protein
MDYTFDPSVFDADAYLMENAIDIEDWEGYDDLKKERLLNVALKTLKRKYPNYSIPDQAVYEFIAILSILNNDINKYQQYGVSSYSITGVSSFNFKDSKIGESIDKYIPDYSKYIIGNANNVNLVNERKVGRTK